MTEFTATRTGVLTSFVQLLHSSGLVDPVIMKKMMGLFIKRLAKELLIQKLNSLTAEKAALEQELAKHQSRNLDLSEANIRKVCNALGKHLCTSNDLETKNYIKSIIDEITVGNDSVSIKLNIA